MKEIVICGFEFNDAWGHRIEFYCSQNDGMLDTIDDNFSEKIAKFESYEQAEEIYRQLQKDFDEYGWYILIKPGK